MDMQKVGNQIAELRKAKHLSQAKLGERLNISFQAVSKWERGESLPDTAILVDLAKVLETTTDYILCGHEKTAGFKGKITIANMIKGIECYKKSGEYLGKQNMIYRYSIKGINDGMNADIESSFSNDNIFECFVAEATIQNIKAGYYVDITDVKNNFKSERLKNIVLDCCEQHGIK